MPGIFGPQLHAAVAEGCEEGHRRQAISHKYAHLLLTKPRSREEWLDAGLSQSSVLGGLTIGVCGWFSIFFFNDSNEYPSRVPNQDHGVEIDFHQ